MQDNTQALLLETAHHYYLKQQQLVPHRDNLTRSQSPPDSSASKRTRDRPPCQSSGTRSFSSRRSRSQHLAAGDPLEGALVHRRVPVAGGTTVGAGALSPGVLGGLVGLESAGNFAVLDGDYTLAGVSQLLECPQGDVTVSENCRAAQEGGSMTRSERQPTSHHQLQVTASNREQCMRTTVTLLLCALGTGTAAAVKARVTPIGTALSPEHNCLRRCCY